MGTWGSGPFDSDAAADFLDEAQASPTRFVAGTLRRIVKTPAGEYIDVDDGAAAWAACELVALAFGHGDVAALDDAVLEVVARLPPREAQRQLALDALPRLADQATSELAGLWHEGGEGARLEASLAGLRARLEAASEGPRVLPKAKSGDVIGLPAAAPSAELVVVQVVGSGEVAVFEGTQPDEARALDAVKRLPARRVPTEVNRLLRRGRLLGNVPLRKDLRGKKLYADESGAIEGYVLMTASGGGLRSVSYEEARALDVLRPHDDDDLRTVALGSAPIERVRSPDAREAALRAENAARWAARRQATGPGPFGDLEGLERLLSWIEEYGIENAVLRFHEEAEGSMGYGRPAEEPERRSYAFAGLVALWCKTWPRAGRGAGAGSPRHDRWPATLAARLPPAPNKKLMARALRAARVLAGRVLTRDAELRLLWEGAEDGGAALREAVASLQRALS